MRFQLVLQFTATSMQEFDELVSVEANLVRNLPATAEVDGHDFGSGEFNIFIYTSQPLEAFVAAYGFIQERCSELEFRAAYRVMSGKDFVIVWPEHLRIFGII